MVDHFGGNKRLVDDVTAAGLLGLSPQTLRNQRSAGQPTVPYIRLGRAIRYDLRDVDAFISTNRIDPNERVNR